MTLNLKTALFCMLFIGTISANAQKEIDPSQSTVTFLINNSGADVEGKLNGLNGHILFDESDLSNASFSVNIPIKGLRSGNSMRDEHLCEEEFFDKKNYPSITFESTKVEKKEGYYLLIGELGMKGITKSASIKFLHSDNQFNGELTINRTHFNVGGDDYSDSIDEQVEIRISCVLK